MKICLTKGKHVKGIKPDLARLQTPIQQNPCYSTHLGDTKADGRETTHFHPNTLILHTLLHQALRKPWPGGRFGPDMPGYVPVVMQSTWAYVSNMH